jgi:3-hydroxymyristoyl/3-hydroxydecanoyl-(acyl carrier protein) dehydratase
MNLPTLRDVRHAEDEVTLDLAVPATLDGFRGHFPGQPVLAGVLQIDWVMQFAARHLGLDQAVARDFQVKFRRVVRPDDALSLHLRLDRPRRNLVFEYRVDQAIVSAGKIKLEVPS